MEKRRISGCEIDMSREGRLPGCKVEIRSGGMKILSRDIIKYVACTYMSDMICACHGDR